MSRHVGIATDDLVRDVLRPVLADLGLASPAAERLLVGTAAHESLLGELRQNAAGGRPGVARGIYQIEPWVVDDFARSWLAYRPAWRDRLGAYLAPAPAALEVRLAGDLVYQTALARLLYYRVPAPLPAADDLVGLARYWKDHWNTAAGAGTVEKWLADWRRLVAPFYREAA